MNKRFVTTVLLALSMSVSTFASSHEPVMPGHASKAAPNMDVSMQMHQVMMPNRQAEVPMSGDVDKDFAQMMIKHHQQAIDMVDIYIKHGRNAKLKAMAMKMRSAQRGEIRRMSAFR